MATQAVGHSAMLVAVESRRFRHRAPVAGADRVARFIIGLLQQVPGTLRTRAVSVNGQPGFVFASEYGRGVLALDIVGSRIGGIRFVANPDKLQALRLPSGF